MSSSRKGQEPPDQCPGFENGREHDHVGGPESFPQIRETPNPTREGHLYGPATRGTDLTVTGCVRVAGRGSVRLGEGVTLSADVAPIELIATDGALLDIAPGVMIGPGASLEASATITVGAGAVVGPFAKILDDHWHTTGGKHALLPRRAPVEVGPGAQIGARATMLPGAQLGPGAVLDDDSVLNSRVPAGCLVRGVPARLVRKLEPDEIRDSATRLLAVDTLPAAFRVPVEAPSVASRHLLQGLAAHERLRRLAGDGWILQMLSNVELALALAQGRRELSSAQQADHVFVHGSLEVRNAGTLLVGRGCGFASGPMVARLDVGPGATLSIGPDSFINAGVVIRARERIRIGRNLQMAARSVILDKLGSRRGPVTLGNDVWLAHGVTVLPGVTVGDGAVVSAGTTVDRDVPAGHLAFGSPMRLGPLKVLPTT